MQMLNKRRGVLSRRGCSGGALRERSAPASVSYTFLPSPKALGQVKDTLFFQI